jgi:hypothetical protein
MSNHQDQGPSSPPAGRSAALPKRLGQSLADFRMSFTRRPRRAPTSSSESDIVHATRPADATSVRAKSSRHGKSTADKWNQ